MSTFVTLCRILACFLTNRGCFYEIRFLFRLFPVKSASNVSFGVTQIHKELGPVCSTVSLIFRVLFLSGCSLVFSVFSGIF